MSGGPVCDGLDGPIRGGPGPDLGPSLDDPGHQDHPSLPAMRLGFQMH